MRRWAACFVALVIGACGEDPASTPAKGAADVLEVAGGPDIAFGSVDVAAQDSEKAEDTGFSPIDAGAESDAPAVEDAHTSKPDAGAPIDDTSAPATDAAARVKDTQATTKDTGAVDSGGTIDAGPTADTKPPTDVDTSKHLARVVLAGDSWSTGLIFPLRAAMDARGFKATPLDYQFTANAGSQAKGWVANKHPLKAGGGEDTSKPKMLDALKKSLDEQPAAELLVLVIGGNDYNRECDAGYGKWGKFLQSAAMDTIEKDVGDLVDAAIIGRPDLQVVIVGYDFFHFEFLKAFGLKLPGHTTKSYNEGLVELDKRRLAIASKRPQVHFAHNLGILQHTFGDTIHPPFSIPNPATGHPEYKPKVAPKPGWAPKYTPMPGGFVTYPAPLSYMPDGIHPNKQGFDAIIGHVLDQGMEAILAGGQWPN